MNSFIIHIKTEDLCKCIPKDIEKLFDVSTFENIFLTRVRLGGKVIK